MNWIATPAVGAPPPCPLGRCPIPNGLPSLPSNGPSASWTRRPPCAGVMLLSGGNGLGKSTLVGRWVRQLETRLYTPVNLTQATLSSSGLLASLARSLGKRASIRRERNLDELSSYLSEHERQTLVIVMDDAQNSTHGTLEELRLLLGLNLPSQPTFALILIGDEYLLGQLQLRNHRALCSRLSAHHLLSPWTLEEIQSLSQNRAGSRGH